MCESTIVWLTPSNIYPTYITKFERKKGKLSSVHNTWKKHDKFLQFLQLLLKFIFSKKATKIDEIFSVDLMLPMSNVVNVKSMVKISSIFVAFLENMNFT